MKRELNNELKIKQTLKLFATKKFNTIIISGVNENKEECNLAIIGDDQSRIIANIGYILFEAIKQGVMTKDDLKILNEYIESKEELNNE